MNLTLVSLAGLERYVRPHELDNYLLHGWQVVQEAQVELFEQEQVVDSGKITTRAPKKKKSEKTAETAPEAAQEDQGNDINKGE